MTLPGRWLRSLFVARPFMRSPKKGAETVVYLASSTEVEGVTGSYYAEPQGEEIQPIVL